MGKMTLNTDYGQQSSQPANMSAAKGADYAADLWEKFKGYQRAFEQCLQQGDKEGSLQYYNKCLAIAESMKSLIPDSTFNITAAHAQTIKKYYDMAVAALDSMEAALRRSQGNTIGDGTGRTDGMDEDPNKTITDPSQIQTWGDLFTFIKNQANTSNSTGMSFMDLLANMIGDKQKYQWQQASDDLAYQRTNFSTLVAQYMAAGMSRQAAIAAASGGSIATSGSSVSSNLSSNLASTALGSQANSLQGQSIDNQYALGMGQLSLQDKLGTGNLEIAAFQAETARQAVNQQATTIEQQQQYLDMAIRSFEATNWVNEEQKQAYYAMQETYGYVYGMHKYGIDVPLYATRSQKTFKDWLRGTAAQVQTVYNMINDGKAFFDEDGLHFQNDETGDWLVNPDLTEALLAGYTNAKRAYESIQKNTGNGSYGDLFERYFMSNAGPRGYHAQEDASKLMASTIAVEQALTDLDSIRVRAQSAEFQQSVHTQVVETLRDGSLVDPDVKARMDNALKDLKWVADFEQGVIIDTETGQQVTVDQLLEHCFPQTAAYLREAATLRQGFYELAKATSYQAFCMDYQTMINNSKARLAQSGLTSMKYEKAAGWFQDSNFLTSAASLKIVMDETVLGDAIGFAANVGLSAVTGGIGYGFARAAARQGQSFNLDLLAAKHNYNMEENVKTHTTTFFNRKGEYQGSNVQYFER